MKETYIKFKDRVVDRGAYTHHGINPSCKHVDGATIPMWAVHIHWKPGGNHHIEQFSDEVSAREFYDSITAQL